MKKYILAAALGSAMIVAVPAFATTTNYTFNTTACGSGGPTACADNIAPYAVTSNGVTATALAVYYTTGTATQMSLGDLGVYSGNGLGACENSNANTDCASPSHQVDNGKNGFSADQYEFVLFKFSSQVSLTSIQLGNYGGGDSDPFNITYYTSSNSSLATALSATTLTSSAFTTTDGFSGPQSLSSQSTTGGSHCVSGSTLCVDNLSGTATNNVQYLLVGALITGNGSDYFKIQDINAYSTSTGASTTPEPATFGMIGLALAGLGIYGRKRKSGRS